MAAFLICSPLRPYTTQTGEIAAGGSLKFYEAGTTTATDIYGDVDLSSNIGDTVTLDAAGFPEAEVWGDAEESYKVRVYTAADTLIDEQDNIGDTGTFTLPSGDDGQFLSLVAGVAAFADVSQVPDMTGHSGKILGTDGTDAIWQAATGTAAATSGGFTIGSLRVQWGSGSVAATGTLDAGDNFNYATPFSAPAYAIFFQVTGAAPTSSGAIPCSRVSSNVATAFGVHFHVSDDYEVEASPDMEIISPITFNYLAIGPK